MNKDKTLKVGIIGLGVGEKHIAGYLKHPKCEVVALCDFSEEKLKMCKEKYSHIKFTKVADEILVDPEVNVVSIASYDNYHYEQIMKALRNGKNVFVEKPLCLFENEAIEIRAELKNNPNLKLSSNLILRLTPRFLCLKKLIKDGVFGDIYYFESDYNYGKINKITSGWRGKIDFYSVVYGGGVHIIDLLLWLSDELVEEVYAYGNNISTKDTQFRYNDFVVSLLKFQSGKIAKVACNFGCVFPHFHALSIYGTKATFINSLENGRLYEARDTNKPARVISEAYPGVEKGDLIYNFLDSIIYEGQPDVTVEDIFNTMSVCFAIEKSINKSRSIKVDYL